MSGTRTTLISGATGFVGAHLVRRLLARGESVVALTRRPQHARRQLGEGVRIVRTLDDLDAQTRVDAIVNLAGARILGAPWTSSRRQQLLSSRLDTTRALTAFMARLPEPVGALVSASAIGFYGVRGSEVIDEGGSPMPIFQSELCQAWESAAQEAAGLGARVVRLRFGVVLGRDGGALPQLARPVRLGLGAIIGTGEQWVSWIHLDDLLQVIELALDQPSVEGVFNAVAPIPVTHRQFQIGLGSALHRPIWLRVPGRLVRLGLGEMAQLLVDGQRVVPARLAAMGFHFNHPSLAEALRDLL